MSEALASAVAAACGITIDAASLRPVGGGSINTAARLESDAGPVFLKTNRADAYEMFAAEADGLAELAAADAVRVPQVHGLGVDAGCAWLLLEYLELGPADDGCRRRLGSALAALHRQTAERHGSDLVVMVTAGPQNMRERLLGSTTEEVVMAAPCPVLAIPAPGYGA